MFTAAIRLEVKHRATNMYSSFIFARLRCYGSKRLSLETKSRFTNSLLQPRLFFDSGSWSRLATHANNVARNPYMRPLHAISGTLNVGEQRFTNPQMLVRMSRALCSDHIALSRLRYFSPFLRSSSEVYLRLVMLQFEDQTSLIRLVVIDMYDVRNAIPELYESLA